MNLQEFSLTELEELRTELSEELSRRAREDEIKIQSANIDSDSSTFLKLAKRFGDLTFGQEFNVRVPVSVCVRVSWEQEDYASIDWETNGRNIYDIISRSVILEQCPEVAECHAIMSEQILELRRDVEQFAKNLGVPEESVWGLIETRTGV